MTEGLWYVENNPPVSHADSVSAVASVGAIGLCPMVATGNPHPLHKGAFVYYIELFCTENTVARVSEAGNDVAMLV